MPEQPLDMPGSATYLRRLHGDVEVYESIRGKFLEIISSGFESETHWNYYEQDQSAMVFTDWQRTNGVAPFYADYRRANAVVFRQLRQAKYYLQENWKKILAENQGRPPKILAVLFEELDYIPGDGAAGDGGAAAAAAGDDGGGMGGGLKQWTFKIKSHPMNTHVGWQEIQLDFLPFYKNPGFLFDRVRGSSPRATYRVVVFTVRNSKYGGFRTIDAHEKETSEVFYYPLLKSPKRNRPASTSTSASHNDDDDHLWTWLEQLKNLLYNLSQAIKRERLN